MTEETYLITLTSLEMVLTYLKDKKTRAKLKRAIIYFKSIDVMTLK